MYYCIFIYTLFIIFLRQLCIGVNMSTYPFYFINLSNTLFSYLWKRYFLFAIDIRFQKRNHFVNIEVYKHVNNFDNIFSSITATHTVTHYLQKA